MNDTLKTNLDAILARRNAYLQVSPHISVEVAAVKGAPKDIDVSCVGDFFFAAARDIGAMATTITRMDAEIEAFKARLNEPA